MKMKNILFCGLMFVLIKFFILSLSVAGDLKSLEDVDFITISSHLENGVLKFDFSYKNRDQDESVFWEGGKINCNCKVYENIGSIIDRKKGQRIANKNKTLTRYGQGMYINISKRYIDKGKRALIECSVYTGYRILNASDDTSLDNR